jgi:tight adherence protein B
VPEPNLDPGRHLAPRPSKRRLARVLGVLLAVLCALPGVAASARAAGLTGWLGSGAQFPNQALVLIPPPGVKASSSTVHVTENGRSVSGVSVTPTAQAGPGDFGLMVVADRSSSMRSGALNAVASGLQNLVGLRRAQQELGVIGFSSRPIVLAQLSADTTGFAHTLPTTPATDNRADVPAAIQLALSKLSAAHVALGAIIVVSDGAGLTGGSVTPTAVSDAAAAARIPIFVVGLHDKAATPASLAALRSAAPGQFVQAPPARLAAVLGDIDRVVTRGYVARWRSSVPLGQAVKVTASLDHAFGTVTAGYQAPASPTGSVKPHPAGSPPAPATHPAALAPGGRLSPVPSFSTAASPLSPPTSGPASSPPQGASASFWSSGTGKLAVAGFVGLLVAATVWLVLYRPARRAVRVRVGSYVHMTNATIENPLAGPVVPSKSIVHRLEHSNRWQAFALNVDIARSARTPMYLVKRAVVVAMLMALLVVLITGSTLLAIVPVLGWWFVLKALMERAANKQREIFRQALPGYLQDLASAIRVGRSLVGALTIVAESADEPFKSELARVVSDEALGRPLDAALEAVAARMDATDLEQVALVAALNRRSGSNVAEALDRVSDGARERQDLRREVKALTAQAKMSSLVLTGLPGALLLAMMVVSPLYAKPLLHTTMGLVALGVSAGMVLAGWKALKKITNVKV